LLLTLPLPAQRPPHVSACKLVKSQGFERVRTCCGRRASPLPHPRLTAFDASLSVPLSRRFTEWTCPHHWPQYASVLLWPATLQVRACLQQCCAVRAPAAPFPTILEPNYPKVMSDGACRATVAW